LRAASETLAGAERPVHPNVFNAEVGTVAHGGHRGLGPRSDEYVKHAPPAVNNASITAFLKPRALTFLLCGD